MITQWDGKHGVGLKNWKSVIFCGQNPIEMKFIPLDGYYCPLCNWKFAEDLPKEVEEREWDYHATGDWEGEELIDLSIWEKNLEIRS